jgi:hypothetical protein
MPAAPNIRPQHITAFAEQMRRLYGSNILDPTAREGLMAAAEMVRKLRIADATAHLKSYAFTLGTTVWFPFDIVKPSEIGGWPFSWQLITIAHEHCHVRQFKEHGTRFMGEYLASPEMRAMVWEAEAFGVAAEVWEAMYGDEPFDAAQLTEPLLRYGCSPEEVAGASQVVRVRRAAILKGAVITPEADQLLQFLRGAQLWTPPPAKKSIR